MLPDSLRKINVDDVSLGSLGICSCPCVECLLPVPLPQGSTSPFKAQFEVPRTYHIILFIYSHSRECKPLQGRLHLIDIYVSSAWLIIGTQQKTNLNRPELHQTSMC